MDAKQIQSPAPASELLECEIAPRPLSYSLQDYHRAGLDGPLHYTWQDKPHRLLYDLIAAVRYYATTQAPAVGPVASKTTLVCPKCGVDRFEDSCPTPGHCPMVGVAQSQPKEK